MRITTADDRKAKVSMQIIIQPAPAQDGAVRGVAPAARARSTVATTARAVAEP
ncbi:MAG: hypothetical protein AB7V44_01285 [Pseudonocardia sp.]